MIRHSNFVIRHFQQDLHLRFLFRRPELCGVLAQDAIQSFFRDFKMKLITRNTVRVSMTAAVAALGGCMIGPNYKPPVVKVNPSFTETQPPPTTQQASTVAIIASPPVEWWRTFHDSELDALIRRAVKGNLNLKQAGSRVRQARAAGCHRGGPAAEIQRRRWVAECPREQQRHVPGRRIWGRQRQQRGNEQSRQHRHPKEQARAAGANRDDHSRSDQRGGPPGRAGKSAGIGRISRGHHEFVRSRF